MERIKQNPFSIFDFFSYAIPGAVATLSVLFFMCSDLCFDDCLSPFESLKIYVENLKIFKVNSLAVSTIFVLISYVLGHIIAYISSITVEKFSIWWFGYPSLFLFEKKSEIQLWKTFSEEWNLKDVPKRLRIISIIRIYCVRFFVFLFLLPLSLMSVLVLLLGMNRFFVRPIDESLVEIIRQKEKLLKDKLLLTTDFKKEHDFFRVVYHYEYERCQSHRQKMDNYVALYDFLRSITLIFNVVTLYVLSLMFVVEGILGFYYMINVIMLMLLTYLSFMSFMKFYRRYTLEVLMCLATDPTLVEGKKLPEIIYNCTE